MSEDALPRAIDELYNAFSKYPRPRTYRACGCCCTGRVLEGEYWNGTSRPVVEVDSPGADLPVRVISPTALADFAEDVPLTAGTIELFKHYLPRLLEIVIIDGFPNDVPDMASVFSHLTFRAEEPGLAWWNWPDDEQTALTGFFDALWAQTRCVGRIYAEDALYAIFSGEEIPLLHWQFPALHGLGGDGRRVRAIGRPRVTG